MYAIAIHGGAGTILRSDMTAERQSEYEAGLAIALKAGEQILQAGGSSIDAVQAAVISLEDCPLFNAGKGSVYNHEGIQEMDASIMCGTSLRAGGAACVHHIKNPILLARAIMDHSEHVLLMGKGAEQYAQEQGLIFEEDQYFYNEFRHQQYQEALGQDVVQLDHTAGDGKKYGTVGAVALDESGHLAAATSTGGLTNKKYGRVGDSCIPGAGTYANDETCAVSCTGVGELFIREVVAYQVHARMAFGGMDLAAAADEVVLQQLVRIKGEGGLIGIDKWGNIHLPFNSDGMYRAYAHSDGCSGVLIYKD